MLMFTRKIMIIFVALILMTKFNWIGRAEQKYRILIIFSSHNIVYVLSFGYFFTDYLKNRIKN